MVVVVLFFFFKQKTAYEMRISDWSSDVCSSDLGEVSGHFHPKASVSLRGRRITAPCFVTDGRRLILPAFGAFTGGLDVLDPAIGGLFANGFQATLLGRSGLFAFPRQALVCSAARPFFLPPPRGARVAHPCRAKRA